MKKWETFSIKKRDKNHLGRAILWCFLIAFHPCLGQTEPYNPVRGTPVLIGQKAADSLAVAAAKSNAVPTQEQPNDSLPEKSKSPGFVEFKIGPAFPLYEFSSRNMTETDPGTADQGMAIEVGSFLHFTPEGQTGWYFGAGYKGFRMTGFQDSLGTIYQDRGEAARELTIFDQPLRYNIVTLSTGLALEGKSDKLAAYGRVLINLNYVDASNFDVRIDDEEHTAKVKASVTSGYSLEFGVRFEKHLSIGAAWTYLGATDLKVELPAAVDQGLSPFPNTQPTELSGIIGNNRMQMIEVKLGYAF